ncbi:MAG: P-II family nitrogen regulator [Corallococcus sp.]|nr:P-II family nitrogen regulator [Corallococcus sp.]
MAKSKFQLIIIVINGGYSDLVMRHAKEAGARGGTVLHARGTGDSEIAAMFGITIQPDKELIIIIAPENDKDAIMKAIAKGAGVNTEAQGIVFSVPVDETIGIFEPRQTVEKEEKKSDPEQTTASDEEQTSDGANIKEAQNNDND